MVPFYESIPDKILVKDGDGRPKYVSTREWATGKKIMLYFSAHWCGPCRAFTPSLVEMRAKIRETYDETCEVLFISLDRSQREFDEYWGSSMPWAAVPWDDDESRSKMTKFVKVMGIPRLVVIGQTHGVGPFKVINPDARQALRHGAGAFPFGLDAHQPRGLAYLNPYVRLVLGVAMWITVYEVVTKWILPWVRS